VRGSGRRRRIRGIAAAMLAACAAAACQPVQPDQLPPLRERNYLCQLPGLGDTHEDEVACEDNKRPLLER
jgi:hypothetical protein